MSNHSDLLSPYTAQQGRKIPGPYTAEYEGTVIFRNVGLF